MCHETCLISPAAHVCYNVQLAGHNLELRLCNIWPGVPFWAQYIKRITQASLMELYIIQHSHRAKELSNSGGHVVITWLIPLHMPYFRYFSQNRPTGPIWTSSLDVCPRLCPLHMQLSQGSKGGPRGAVPWKNLHQKFTSLRLAVSKKMQAAPFLIPAKTKILVLLSTLVKRFGVSGMRYFCVKVPGNQGQINCRVLLVYFQGIFRVF